MGCIGGVSAAERPGLLSLPGLGFEIEDPGSTGKAQHGVAIMAQLATHPGTVAWMGIGTGDKALRGG
jgi:hypothetical protein